MHQTFYIDIDEEITSVVERLRHARASEIILVVPKRALLIQSIVNLRILKREADEARLQLMMVTQDKLGKILIEKAGIFVQQKMDNISDEEISVNEDSQPAEEYRSEEVEIKNNKDRLSTIGSSSYFDEAVLEENIKLEQDKLKTIKPVSDKENSDREILTNRELVLTSGKESEKRLIIKSSFDLKPATSEAKLPIRARLAESSGGGGFPNKEKTVGNAQNRSNPKPNPNFNPNLNPNLNPNPIPRLKPNFAPVSLPAPLPKSNPTPNLNSAQEVDFQDKKIENFFYQPNAIARQEKKGTERSLENYNLPGKVHRWFWVFGFVAFLLATGIGIYVFVPKADLVVFVKQDSKTIDSKIIGKTSLTSIDLAEESIHAKAVSSAQEVSESYESSGSALVSNQKSHGMVTIYNEYNSSPQSLVATTRFLASDGKLFRLVKSVTVPGMSTSDGQTKSGQIDAEITADESGEEYNIGPSTFNIPGFKSSGVKYEKIYAKSAVAMTGGGNGANESRVITENDIAAAKSKLLTILNAKLEDDLKKAGMADAIIPDGAMTESDVVYELSNSAGDVANSFKVTAGAEAKALVVSQLDLQETIATMLKKASDEADIEKDSIKMDFSRSEADLANGTINIKFHAEGKIKPQFSADTIKKAILGKNEEQIKNYLSELPNVEKVEVNYWPPFISGRIPLLPSRVSVSLDGI